MPNDKYATLGSLYANISREITDVVGGDLDGVYMFAHAGPGSAGGAIFKDEGETLRYFDPSDRLGEMLIDAWEAEDPDKRWSIIEYRLTGSHFEVWFTFPDEMDPTWRSPRDGRQAAVVRQFGDKPIIYPPWPDEEAE